MARLPNPAALEQSFSRRSFVIGSIQGGVGLLLAVRMGYIAVAENEKYEMEAESNRVNLSLIVPQRGWILDRNGSPLVSNRSDYRVDIDPQRLGDEEQTKQTLKTLGNMLAFTDSEKADLSEKVDSAASFQPVPVISGLDFETYAALSVRLPEMPGVIPQQGYSRYYPTGPSVGHLIGYVAAPSREDYEADRIPLLVTPGFKIGRDGLEKQFEQELRGKPGARRVEVTAAGRIVRNLDTRHPETGQAVQLTIDSPLQDFASRRIGLESGSVVVLDCHTGDLLCMTSMPSFDPNSFSNGIGRIEYKMLSEHERVPLRNKVLSGLYPPASTVKPMVSMAFLKAGLDPEATVRCNGGLRIAGDRVFRCWNRRGHGNVNMAKAIYQSCDVYFYHFSQQVGMDAIADMARHCGMGQAFDLPVLSQFYGTVPDPAWKQKKYGESWRAFDTVNATIGQGYMLTNPLQLAVMGARLATGKQVMPQLLLGKGNREYASMGFSDEHINHIRQSMADVVSGIGTARRARLPFSDIRIAGKTGTAQVVGLDKSNGKTGPWKYRDHGLFMFFAPFDNPRYAGAVVIEHGGGSGSAYPIARDVATYLFDPQKGLDRLHALERSWGGTAEQRLNRTYARYAQEAGVAVPPAPEDPTGLQGKFAAEAWAGTQPEFATTEAFVPREDATPTSGAPE